MRVTPIDTIPGILALCFKSGVVLWWFPVTLVAVLSGCNGAMSVVSKGEEQNRPIAVLIEWESWITRPKEEGEHFLLGAESARFALYEDRTVIYRVPGAGTTSYGIVRLSENEGALLLGSLGLDGLWGLKESYDITAYTERPRSEIFIWSSRGRKSISVDGDLRVPELRESCDDDPELAQSYEDRRRWWSELVKEGRRSVPSEFLRAYDVMVCYDNPRAVPWLPERIEVVVKPFDGPAVPWPEDWPTPKSGDLVGNNSYRVYIGSAGLRRLQEVLRAGQCFSIQGETWAFDYRIPLPGEEEWMQ
jgi:hypothetical protein